MKDPWNIGAESLIFKHEQWGHTMLLKHRPAKPYLLEDIDHFLRTSRTSRECKMLTVARSLGVPTPKVYWIDTQNHTIAMDYIPGKQLKQLVNEVSTNTLQRLTNEFGGLIALLHRGGVVHGDPTTSNVVVGQDGKMWIVDFGLAEMNATVEMKGVDLHLMRRAFETTHWNLEDEMWKSTLKGYENVLGHDAKQIFSRVEEIRERGRYH